MSEPSVIYLGDTPPPPPDPRRALAVLLRPDDPLSRGGAQGGALSLRQATVVSVQASSVTIRMAGSTTNIPGVKTLVACVVNAAIWVTQNGPDLLVVGVVDTGWIVPTLSGTWTNYGGSFTTAAYRKMGGVVYLKGLVKGGGLTTIYTLPVGFRPNQIRIYAVIANNGVGRLDVYPDGTVLFNVGADPFVSMDGISFPVDQ